MELIYLSTPTIVVKESPANSTKPESLSAAKTDGRLAPFAASPDSPIQVILTQKTTSNE